MISASHHSIKSIMQVVKIPLLSMWHNRYCHYKVDPTNLIQIFVETFGSSLTLLRKAGLHYFFPQLQVNSRKDQATYPCYGIWSKCWKTKFKLVVFRWKFYLSSEVFWANAK